MLYLSHLPGESLGKGIGNLYSTSPQDIILGIMAEYRFEPNVFFDLEGFEHVKVFDGVSQVWEVLPELAGYVGGKVGEKKALIGQGTVVEEGAFIKGPAIIGKNCFIAHGAYIREHVILGNNVHIGHGSEIKHSVILSNTAVAHLNYVGDSIVGSGVNMGGGVKTANFRLDGKTIRIKTSENVIDTGLAKLGAIIGDGCKIGVNAVLNPGTILGKDCMIYPLVSAFGVHQDGETIR